MAFWVMTSLNLVDGYKYIVGKCWGGVPIVVSQPMALCISIKKVKETLQSHKKQFQRFYIQ